MKRRHKLPRTERHRANVERIYGIAHKIIYSRARKQMDGADWLLDYRNQNCRHAANAENARERYETRRAQLQAKRDGKPWPVCDRCAAGNHQAGCTHQTNIPEEYFSWGQTLYDCACPCTVSYPYTKRRCWCSPADLRASVRLPWLPLSWIRKLHEWWGWPYQGICTPRWQSIYR